ncbi:MAG: response regulator [bacterium]|nr:response regulator [bacterium]
MGNATNISTQAGNDAESRKLVLLIDDESVIRELGTEMLEGLDMDCITASTGETGIDLYRRRKDDIYMVILDVELPGICGDEVFEVLREITPDVKILLVSGHAQEFIEQRFFKRIVKHFMSKPFHEGHLRESIDKLMNG